MLLQIINKDVPKEIEKIHHFVNYIITKEINRADYLVILADPKYRF